MKRLFLSVLIFAILVAGVALIIFGTKGEERIRPWDGYAYDEAQHTFRFGLINVQFDYGSLDECIQDLNWKTKVSLKSSPYKEQSGSSLPPALPLILPRIASSPFGCAFMSNNFLKTYLVNYFSGGVELKFICEALDPKYTYNLMRYQPALDKLDNDEYHCTKLYHFFGSYILR